MRWCKHQLWIFSKFTNSDSPIILLYNPFFLFFQFFTLAITCLCWSLFKMLAYSVPGISCNLMLIHSWLRQLIEVGQNPIVCVLKNNIETKRDWYEPHFLHIAYIVELLKSFSLTFWPSCKISESLNSLGILLRFSTVNSPYLLILVLSWKSGALVIIDS